jgi:GAF domain-containing protein
MVRYFEECLTIKSVLDFTLAQGLCLSETDLGNVQLMDWKTGYLQIAAQRGFGDEFLTFFKRVNALSSSACGRALRKRESIIIEDITSDLEFSPCRPIAGRAGFRAVQSTPIVSKSGAMIGILSTHFPAAHRPSGTTMDALKDLARSAANAVIFQRSKMNDVNFMIERSRRALEDSRRAIAQAKDTVRRSAVM